MDMITKIQLEDAIKNDNMVRERILTVARIVGGMEGTLIIHKMDIKDWQLDRYYDHKNTYPEDMQHLMKVYMSIRYYDSDDEEQRISRVIEFPKDYLFTDDWLPRAEALAKRNKAQWAKIYADNLEKTIENTLEKIKDMRKQLKELRKESIGWDVQIK